MAEASDRGGPERASPPHPQAALFKQAIADDYYFEMMLDELPIWAYVGELETKSVNLNRQFDNSTRYHLFTHLDFSIAYNGKAVIEVNVTAQHAAASRRAEGEALREEREGCVCRRTRCSVSTSPPRTATRPDLPPPPPSPAEGLRVECEPPPLPRSTSPTRSAGSSRTSPTPRGWGGAAQLSSRSIAPFNGRASTAAHAIPQCIHIL